MQRLPSILFALAVLPFLAFAAFGFLASFEPLPGALAWRLGYGAAVVLLAALELALVRRAIVGPSRPPDSQ